MRHSKRYENKRVKALARKESVWVWPIKIFFLALALSLLFSIASEFLASRVGVVLSLFCIFFFISVSVLTDMVGVAVTSCDEKPFEEMCKQNKRGAHEALFLIRNADRVASLCADVIGDVCGILSGAAGSTILYHIVTQNSSSAFEIIVASVISALIAGLTIFGKAIFKRYSMNNCDKVILFLGKGISFFTRRRKKVVQEEKTVVVEAKVLSRSDGEK